MIDEKSLLNCQRKVITDTKIPDYHGRITSSTGDYQKQKMYIIYNCMVETHDSSTSFLI